MSEACCNHALGRRVEPAARWPTKSWLAGRRARHACSGKRGLSPGGLSPLTGGWLARRLTGVLPLNTYQECVRYGVDRGVVFCGEG